MDDWKPQPYIRQAQQLGVAQSILDAAVAASEAVVAAHPSLPPILTLRHLAHLTDTSYLKLRDWVSREIEDPYRVFRIKKRPVAPNCTAFRTICVPDVELAFLQRWLSRNVLSWGRPHSASTAFAPGSTLLAAVEPHCGSRWLVKLDVRRFFESISEVSVYKAFRRLGYQPLVSLELARLCTRVGPASRLYANARWTRRAPRYVAAIRKYAVVRFGHLPQGAPTSPMLANLVMRDVDEELTKVAKLHGMTYTRYADDLTFSTPRRDFGREIAVELIQKVYRSLGRFGLQPNLAKTQVVPPRSRKVVLGLLVDGKEPRLTREFKNKMRQHLYYLERPDVGAVRHAQARGFSAVAGLRNHLLGLAAYASQVEPQYGAELARRLNAVSWPVVY
ncbi:RNA-directed DNA polymerase [Mitsuaria sp. PDC51]|uniref:reverse transcriptase family protein n=1 Tax=Mitsuaria sp. PDC51 TaxID=1881035 RepID=UPI0008EF0889|nr:reverse transcriptase family protein [Mitsuaria sp. PDC51]SFR74946.1 RNA-directed DNA polymerase [Mitsuaria sp. PDC51]